MGTKTKTVWKYERDCIRQEGMIDATAKHGKPPAPQWAHLARHVVKCLREARAEATPLALHFLALSATEMLEGRHINSKLCLVTAMSLANKGLMGYQMRLFQGAFARPQVSDIEEMLAQGVNNLLSKLADLPEGENVVELGPGMKAHVIKKMLKPPKAKSKKKKAKFNPFSSSDPRLN